MCHSSRVTVTVGLALQQQRAAGAQRPRGGEVGMGLLLRVTTRRVLPPPTPPPPRHHVEQLRCSC